MQPDRGARAYLQARGYIAAGNPRVPERRLRRMAWRYLMLTASPPLTRQEKRSARQLRRRGIT